jgi:hypothetical protein
VPSNEIKRLRRSLLDLVNFTDKSAHPFIRISGEHSQTVEIWGAIVATIHVKVAAARTTAAPGWRMKRERLTPRYTTCWDEMAIARA